jgi:hypothetical protein
MGKATMLKELKNIPATPRLTNGALTPREQTVLGYLTYGIDEPDPNHPDIPTGKPLGPYQVSTILGVRRKYVRSLLADPVFKAEMARATADARAALQPKAVHVLGELLEWRGEGKAADANVVANAAKAIIGDDLKAGVNVSLNVNNQVGVALRPGYVIRLPARDKPAAPVIDAKPIAPKP